MKQAIAKLLVDNVIQPMIAKELKDSCFKVEIINNRGDVNIRIMGCKAGDFDE